jgi:hypothetical protein
MRGLVFLVRASHHDLDRIVVQRSLQRLSFIPRPSHPSSRSSSVSRITGMAFGRIGSTMAFGDVVRRP